LKRRYNGELLEMTIAGDVAREWYGSSEDLYLYELEWCRKHIQPGVTVVDCGAHQGLMTMLFARWTGPAGKVIAYELLQDNASALAANLALNSISNVTVRPVGLGDQNERRDIVLNKGNCVVLESHNDHGLHIVRLDDDLEPGVKVDFLKVDVEGSDLGMLRGAKRIISQRPFIDLEIHNFLFADRVGTLSCIFEILPPQCWRYEVLTRGGDSTTQSFDQKLDLRWLAQFDNPHVFCTSRSNGVGRYLRQLWPR
jgi:FkbM family methyltransferase